MTCDAVRMKRSMRSTSRLPRRTVTPLSRSISQAPRVETQGRDAQARLEHSTPHRKIALRHLRLRALGSACAEFRGHMGRRAHEEFAAGIQETDSPQRAAAVCSITVTCKLLGQRRWMRA